MGCGSTCQDLSFRSPESCCRLTLGESDDIFHQIPTCLSHVCRNKKNQSGLVFLQRHKMMAMVCAGISLSLGLLGVRLAETLVMRFLRIQIWEMQHD